MVCNRQNSDLFDRRNVKEHRTKSSQSIDPCRETLPTEYWTLS